MTTPAEIQNELDHAIAALKATTVAYPRWAKYTDAQKQETSWKTAFDLLATARAAVAALTPDPTPTPGTIASPQPPITTVKDADLPVNIYTGPATLQDYIIDGSADSGVLVHMQAHGTQLRRFHMTRIGALPWANSWARHGIYGKVHDLLLEDFWVECAAAAQIGQCYSMRMANQTVRRFHGEGAPHVIGYFQEKDDYGNAAADPNTYLRGSVLFEDGDGSFTGDTAVWLDTDTAATCEQQFTFRRCHFDGAGAWFVRCNKTVFTGHVTLEGCTLHGDPVTAAAADIPPGQLTIS